MARPLRLEIKILLLNNEGLTLDLVGESQAFSQIPLEKLLKSNIKYVYDIGNIQLQHISNIIEAVYLTVRLQKGNYE